MPAVVESMFSAREVPWHGLGTITEDVLTAKEAIVAGGLDWTVALEPLLVDLGAEAPVVLEDRHAVVRSRKTGKDVLGVVGSKYRVFQNADAFAFADNMVDDGRAKYETAGSLRGGRVVFLTMKVPMEMKVAGEDAHDMYLVLRTSHDGSTAISACVSPIRVVCMNTVTMAFRGAKHRWSVPHTSTMEGKLQEARETLQLTFEYADQFVARADDMVSVKTTEDQVRNMLTDTLPNRPKTEEVVDMMMYLYNDSPTNGFTGTGWGAFNALTEYFDHCRETSSQEAVFSNIMEGEIARFRNELAGRILELV